MFTDVMCDLTKELGMFKEQVPNETLAILDKFNNGYLIGYHWPDAWKHRPGGPFIYGTTSHYCTKYSGKCNGCSKLSQSKAEYKAWMNGWDIGNAKKLADGRSNPVPTTEAIRAFNEGKRVDTLFDKEDILRLFGSY